MRVEAVAMAFNGIRPTDLVLKPFFNSYESSGLQNIFVGTKIKLKNLQFIWVTFFQRFQLYGQWYKRFKGTLP